MFLTSIAAERPIRQCISAFACICTVAPIMSSLLLCCDPIDAFCLIIHSGAVENRLDFYIRRCEEF